MFKPRDALALHKLNYNIAENATLKARCNDFERMTRIEMTKQNIQSMFEHHGVKYNKPIFKNIKTLSTEYIEPNHPFTSRRKMYAQQIKMCSYDSKQELDVTQHTFKDWIGNPQFTEYL